MEQDRLTRILKAQAGEDDNADLALRARKKRRRVVNREAARKRAASLKKGAYAGSLRCTPC